MSELYSSSNGTETSGPKHFSARALPTNARLVLADGKVFEGYGIGATGSAVGEVCFNTSITGYQEILTDPSYAGQIIAFTFPHIGNVGTNPEDVETQTAVARGIVIKGSITTPSNFRATQHLHRWLQSNNIVGISGIDTRALTRHIRENGMPKATIAFDETADFDLDALAHQAQEWSGLEGLDLAKDVTCRQSYDWVETSWQLERGFAERLVEKRHIVAIDFGIKRNILRLFADRNCRLTVVPAHTSADDILALNPDGVFLSNGPGDPAATGDYAVPTIRRLVDTGLPIFGICLGHQMLALALGATTEKMHQGHHGANHPVKDLTTDKVEIVSMNHGFTVARDSLPDNVQETHVSLFDQTNCGIAVSGKPIFSVQYHPEANPGPQDSHYLFDRFIDLIDNQKK